MSDDKPAGPSSADTPTDAGHGTESGAELPSIAALARAADPALSGIGGTEASLPAFDGGITGQADDHVYDGHVALVLDPGLLSGMDHMLDLLTTSADLFDVPVMDIGGASDDATPT